MSKKKRKTRQEKIILQLKRELAKQQPKPSSLSTKNEVRQGAISPPPQPKTPRHDYYKRTDNTILSYDPRLIKKDLLKTLALATIVFSLEFMLYLRLR